MTGAADVPPGFDDLREKPGVRTVFITEAGGAGTMTREGGPVEAVARTSCVRLRIADGTGEIFA
ncbi:hypothetical protein [Actinomadura sp. CNU-125]|uniref:hypothetical protein n=1 Tax=Actinomadura sp. CNU-125 TaxID=1904961 RepID=UPI00117883FF|nr:hypothetical protein [Actinomadura sp. CNU-125]